MRKATITVKRLPHEVRYAISEEFGVTDEDINENENGATEITVHDPGFNYRGWLLAESLIATFGEDSVFHGSLY
jgi:hypothetical protein